MRKSILERRIERLEKALMNKKRRKFESEGKALTQADARKFEVLLNSYESVEAVDGCIIVTLDWDYFGEVEFRIAPASRGYDVYQDGDGADPDVPVHFTSLGEVSDHINELNYEAAMDL